MNLILIGGGGREHAILRSLKKNPAVETVWMLPGNGAMESEAVCTGISATDLDAIVAFAKEHPVDYAVVAPDDPLVLGCVDRLNELNIPCFGPKANAAIIEGSKAFSKNLMKKYGIPTAAYEIFSELDAALEYLKTAPIPTVVKADGLALGKGVIIAPDPRRGCGSRHRYDGKRQVRQERHHRRHRGVPGRPRGLRPELHRRQDRQAHGLLHGPQARQGQR